MYGAVYMTVNTANNKKYIGSLIYNRINDWEKYLGSGVELQKDIKKYGRSKFYKIIVSEHDSEQDLREAEELLIKQYDAVNSDEFYNIKYSAIGGDTFTTNPHREETRLKHSKNAKGSNNHQYDKVKTEHFINKIKEANSKPIKIDGTVYSSASEASRILNIKKTTIDYRLNGSGFSNYKRLLPKNKGSYSTNKPKKVKIYGTIYNSLREASLALNCSVTKIRKRIEFDEEYMYID